MKNKYSAPKPILVKRCARCGEDHEVKFKRFKHNPITCDEGEYTHWGMCPSLEEPVLMYITEREDGEGND